MIRHRITRGQIVWLLSDVADLLGVPAASLAARCRRWHPGCVHTVAGASLRPAHPSHSLDVLDPVAVAAILRHWRNPRAADDHSRAVRRGLRELELASGRAQLGRGYTVRTSLEECGRLDLLDAAAVIGRYAAQRYRDEYGCEPETVREEGHVVACYRGLERACLDYAIGSIAAGRPDPEQTTIDTITCDEDDNARVA